MQNALGIIEEWPDQDFSIVDCTSFAVRQRLGLRRAASHSQFQMGRDEMTERILRALDDPHVTFVGHPDRPPPPLARGYSVDYDRIFDKAAERGVILVDRGVLLSIHPGRALRGRVQRADHPVRGWRGRRGCWRSRSSTRGGGGGGGVFAGEETLMS